MNSEESNDHEILNEDANNKNEHFVNSIQESNIQENLNSLTNAYKNLNEDTNKDNLLSTVHEVLNEETNNKNEANLAVSCQEEIIESSVVKTGSGFEKAGFGF